ncbi:MAG: putative secreted protein containing fibronectin type III protein, partial [uncultured bacterium]
YQQGYDAAPRGGGGGMIISNNTDTTPPVISLHTVTDIGDKTAVITWQANENSDGVIEYGFREGAYNKKGIDDNPRLLQTSHKVSLFNLTPYTTYYYQVTSADKSHNVSAPLSGSFTTSLVKEDGTVIPGESETMLLDEADAESVYLASLQRAGEIIRSMSSQVSLGVLESTLLEQNSLISELARILPTPVISGEAVVEAGATYVTISWMTDKISNSLIDIGADDVYKKTGTYEQTVGDSTAEVVSHVVNVRGLRPNTIYHYSLISRTPTGVEARSKDFTFRTKAETSEITTYKAETLSETETVFSWITNVPTDSTLTYTPYTNGIPNKTASQVMHSNAYATEHSLTLVGLEAGVVYDIELSGQDYGKSTVSKNIQGYTTDGQDLAPIVYQIQTDSSIIPGAKDKIQVIISWMTNELSTSRVLYRKGFSAENEDFQDSTSLDQNYIRKHIVVVTNFEPGAVYQFQVESTDSAGNTTRSKTMTVLTPRKQESVFQVIMGNFQDIFSWVGKIQN